MADTEQNHAPPSFLEPAIDAVLAVLSSIEARYWDELAKLERSYAPSSVKDRLREQLDTKRRLAREPHVLCLGELYETGYDADLQMSKWRGSLDQGSSAP
jgi:hypothetical protein